MRDCEHVSDSTSTVRRVSGNLLAPWEGARDAGHGGRDDVGSVSPIWNCRYVARAWMRRGKGAGEGERGGDGKERRKERMRAHASGKVECYERVVTKRA